MMNKSTPFWAGILLLLAACSESPKTQTFQGTWAITSMTSAHLDSLKDKDTVSVKEAIGLWLLNDSIKPALIITAKDIILKWPAGDSDVVAYTLAGTNDKSYQLQTKDGPGTVVLGQGTDATLSIAGATYQLKRQAEMAK